jgi:hypothetical protein
MYTNQIDNELMHKLTARPTMEANVALGDSTDPFVSADVVKIDAIYLVGCGSRVSTRKGTS